MKLNIIDLSEKDAIELSKWQYDGEYAVYNYPDWETIVNQNWAIANEEKRNNQFKKIINENKDFVGYFRILKEEKVITIGLGMNPLYCGQGLGNAFMLTILSYIKTSCDGCKVQLEVRDFNQRAIKCYQKVGFKIIDHYEKETLVGKNSFIKMELVNK